MLFFFGYWTYMTIGLYDYGLGTLKFVRFDPLNSNLFLGTRTFPRALRAF